MRTTQFIRKQVVSRTLTLLEELADEGETERSVEGKDEKETVNRFDIFYREFGRMLKEGVYHETDARERISKLLRFHTTHGDDDSLTSLADYVARADAEQKSIYYVAADSLAAAKASPHIEGLRKNGHEVLLMTEAIDEWVVDSLREFDGKAFVSAAKGALDLPESDEDKQKKEEREKELKPVLERVQQALDEHVKTVRLTDRLTDSPACLVSDEHGMSARQEKVLREAGHEVPKQKRILELNADHAVVKKLQGLGDESGFADWTKLLYDQALLAEGTLPSDPAAFSKRLTKLMAGE